MRESKASSSFRETAALDIFKLLAQNEIEKGKRYPWKKVPVKNTIVAAVEIADSLCEELEKVNQ